MEIPKNLDVFFNVFHYIDRKHQIVFIFFLKLGQIGQFEFYPGR